MFFHNPFTFSLGFLMFCFGFFHDFARLSMVVGFIKMGITLYGKLLLLIFLNFFSLFVCVNITWSQGQDRSHPNGWALKPVQLLSFFFCYIKSYKMFVENDDLLRDNPVFTDASLLCRVISFFLLRKSTKEKRNETTARVRLFWIVFPFLISCFHPQWPSKRQNVDLERPGMLDVFCVFSF